MDTITEALEGIEDSPGPDAVMVMRCARHDMESAMERGRELRRNGVTPTFAMHGDCPVVRWREPLSDTAWTGVCMSFGTFAELVAFAHGYRTAKPPEDNDHLSMWRETGCAVYEMYGGRPPANADPEGGKQTWT